MVVVVGAGALLARRWAGLGMGEMKVRRTCRVLLLGEVFGLCVIAFDGMRGLLSILWDRIAKAADEVAFWWMQGRTI